MTCARARAQAPCCVRGSALAGPEPDERSVHRLSHALALAAHSKEAGPTCDGRARRHSLEPVARGALGFPGWHECCRRCHDATMFRGRAVDRPGSVPYIAILCTGPCDRSQALVRLACRRRLAG
eukprot:scaffold4504_cov116-Isochrysis_galbana.AAC.10